MQGGRAYTYRLVAACYPCDTDGSGWVTEGEGGCVGRKPRSGNERLRALVEESGVSHKGLARRVVDLGTARGVRGLAYDHSSVAAGWPGSSLANRYPS